MARVLSVYDHTLKMLCQDLDWPDNTINLALVTSAYTLDLGHTSWSQASGSEVSSGTGYTTGGQALTNKTAADTNLDADDVTFSSLTKTFRAGILYASGTYNGVVDPLIAYLLYDDTAGGTDVTVSGNDYDVIWNANGIFTLSVT